MLRRILTAMLLIATVAGPQWCCCRLRADSDEGTCEIAHRETAVRKACCAAKPVGNSEQQSPADDHSCPCRQRSRDLLNANGTTEIVQSLTRAAAGVWELFILDGAICNPYATVLTVILVPFPDSPPAKLSGCDLLRAYSILRC